LSALPVLFQSILLIQGDLQDSHKYRTNRKFLSTQKIHLRLGGYFPWHFRRRHLSLLQNRTEHTKSTERNTLNQKKLIQCSQLLPVDWRNCCLLNCCLLDQLIEQALCRVRANQPCVPLRKVEIDPIPPLLTFAFVFSGTFVITKYRFFFCTEVK